MPTHDSSKGSQPERLGEALRGAAKGDADAWARLVRAYSPRVFGLLRAQCRDVDLAEEITQSVFVTVVAKIGSYTEEGKFEAWLFRIAMNRLRDEMRRRRRQARPVESDTLAEIVNAEARMGGPGLGPIAEGARPREGGSILADPAQAGALRAAMAQLSDADQVIIHLRHAAGLSFRQIADVLEQPLGTVLARQHRALKKLKELLAEMGMNPAENEPENEVRD